VVRDGVAVTVRAGLFSQIEVLLSRLEEIREGSEKVGAPRALVE
jgi:hypothetical protein